MAPMGSLPTGRAAGAGLSANEAVGDRKTEAIGVKDNGNFDNDLLF